MINDFTADISEIIHKAMRECMHCKRFDDGACVVSSRSKCLCRNAAETAAERITAKYSLMTATSVVEMHK
jgi:hypothetical protein